MNRRTHLLGSALTAAVLSTALFQCGAAGAQTTGAQPTTAPARTTAQIAATDQPGVDLIELDISGTISTFDANLNFGTLLDWAQTDPTTLTDAAADDESAVVDDLLAQVAANPGTYLTKGAESDQDLAGALQGSGFTVTPDGYIVTNAHVAAPSDADLAGMFLDAVGQDALQAVTTSLATQFGQVGADLDDAQMQALAQVAAGFVQDTAVLSDVTTSIHVGGGPELSGNLGDTGQVARLVGAGKEFPDEDVAIIKIDAHNLPTVAMGDDTALSTGDPVSAIGYPGDATFNAATSADVQAHSTVSNGVVNNRLQSPAANYQFIENTATINHGSSGGPLLDGQGKVVGITTAVDPSDPTTGLQGGKFFYAVPSSVITKYLVQNNVHPSSSPDQGLYDQALTLAEGHHYKAALGKLREAQADGYTTPYLAMQISKVQGQLGQDVPVATPMNWTPYLYGAGGLLVLVVAGAGLVLVRRRRRPAPPVDGSSLVTPPTPQPAPSTGTPEFGPAGQGAPVTAWPAGGPVGSWSYPVAGAAPAVGTAASVGVAPAAPASGTVTFPATTVSTADLPPVAPAPPVATVADAEWTAPARPWWEKQ